MRTESAPFEADRRRSARAGTLLADIVGIAAEPAVIDAGMAADTVVGMAVDRLQELLALVGPYTV